MIRVFVFLVLCFASVISARASMASDYKNTKSSLYVDVERVYVYAQVARIWLLPEEINSQEKIAKIVSDVFEERFDPERCKEMLSRIRGKNPYECNKQPIHIVTNQIVYNPYYKKTFDPLTKDEGTLHVIFKISVAKPNLEAVPPRDKPSMTMNIMVYREGQLLPTWQYSRSTGAGIDNNGKYLVEKIRNLARSQIY